MTGMAKARASLVVLPLLAALAVGCSSDGGDGGNADDELNVPSSSPTPEPTEEPSEVEAELESLYRAYYAALVEMENAEDIDPSLLDGIVGDNVREEQVGRIQQLKNAGVVLEGESVITDVTVTVDGDAGVVEGCVDTSGRKFFDSNGDELTVEERGRDGSVVGVELTEDGWLITDDRGSEGASLTC